MKFQLPTTSLHYNFLLLLTLLVINPLLPGTAYADQQILLNQLQDQATQQKLWQQSEWLNLLHYEGSSETSDDYKSPVRDKHFYLTGNDSHNAKNELLATIAGFYNAELIDDENPQCKYIARFNWLSKKLNIDPTTLPTVHCKKYINWRKNIQPEQVTLIFPAYHLNSPSSMFGHTLLRLDPGIDKGESKWLSVAINFGANPPDGENSLLYAYKGLAGGYPGTFVSDYYFKKIQEYNRMEHRDIWEYRLNLTAEETELMVTHLWELQDVDFDYYFFDENCSYRILELLEIARPGIELTDEFIAAAIPVDTVKAIEAAKLIESVSYRPARATEIQNKLSVMTKQHRESVLQLSADLSVLKSENFSKLPVKQQKTIVDLAYKYLRYQQTEGSRGHATAKRSHQLLQALNNYPVEIDISNTLAIPSAPEKGHNSKRATLGLGQRLNNNYAELDFKMSFHDLEDNKDGFLQGAQINIGSIKIRAEENVGLRLYQLDFVDIFSLTPKDEFFDPLSWKVVTGFERQLTGQKDQLTYHLTGGAGGTWQIVKNHQFYTLAIGRLEINKQLRNTFEPAIGFNTGFLSHFKNTTAHLEVSGEQFEDDIYRLRAQYTQNIIFSTNHSIKLFASHEWHEDGIDFSDINLSYQYYF